MQEALVELAQRGDAEAFDTLARQVGDRCLAIAVRILRDIDSAEDAVQAARITAWVELRSRCGVARMGLAGRDRVHRVRRSLSVVHNHPGDVCHHT